MKNNKKLEILGCALGTNSCGSNCCDPKTEVCCDGNCIPINAGCCAGASCSGACCLNSAGTENVCCSTGTPGSACGNNGGCPCGLGTNSCGSNCCDPKTEVCCDGNCIPINAGCCAGASCTGACCLNSAGTERVCCSTGTPGSACGNNGGCPCGLGTNSCGSNCCNPSTEKCCDGNCIPINAGCCAGASCTGACCLDPTGVKEICCATGKPGGTCGNDNKCPCGLGTTACGSNCCDPKTELCCGVNCLPINAGCCADASCTGACCEGVGGSGQQCCPNLKSTDQCPAGGGCSCSLGTNACGSNCCDTNTEQCCGTTCIDKDHVCCNDSLCSGLCCSTVDGKGQQCCTNLSSSDLCPDGGGCTCASGTTACGSSCCGGDTPYCCGSGADAVCVANTATDFCCNGEHKTSGTCCGAGISGSETTYCTAEQTCCLAGYNGLTANACVTQGKCCGTAPTTTSICCNGTWETPSSLGLGACCGDTWCPGADPVLTFIPSSASTGGTCCNGRACNIFNTLCCNGVCVSSSQQCTTSDDNGPCAAGEINFGYGCTTCPYGQTGVVTPGTEPPTGTCVDPYVCTPSCSGDNPICCGGVCQPNCVSTPQTGTGC